MKFIHSLPILTLAAALGATGHTLGGWGRSEAVLSPSARVTTVPWLTEAWSDEDGDAEAVDGAGDARAAGNDGEHLHAAAYAGTDDSHARAYAGDDPHAGLYDDGAHAGVDDPHAGLYDDGDPHAGLYEGSDSHAGLHEDGAGPHVAGPAGDPHAGAAPSGAPVARVARSQAANGKTIAEVFAERAALAQKPVRVRGTIVKLTENVLGKTYLHLQDGSGRAEAGDGDLTVTTTEAFELGEVVELEGQLALDQDVGVGYVYAALLSDATRVSP